MHTASDSANGDGARATVPSMPYIDQLLEDLGAGDAQTESALGRHVHWGLWEEPATADGSHDDYGAAAERMSRHLCDTAEIHDGMHVLDCGCGIGGTVASLNERFSAMRLTGLNIDARQLAVAGRRVTAREGNEVKFVVGDACLLPFEDATFDAVLAVEAIFHFRSRLRFLREAARVLRPGGVLVVSDFLLRPRGAPALLRIKLGSSLNYYGRQNQVPPTLLGYLAMLRLSGLTLRQYEDITRKTLPSYGVLIDRYRRIGDSALVEAGSRLHEVSRRGLFPYTVLAAEKGRRRA
ncbi:MAG TPA: methyltransferase domain-containing protein [Solirubrobacteraceae bacterium]|nr:methyltransferase domain-containing protein [Solirubrobacteraceae bacterium]